MLLRSALILLLPALLAAGPALRVDRLRHGFGDVPRTPPVSTTFIIGNGGTSDLRILRVVPACDCTTAEVDASVVPPGGSAFLRVTFDPVKDKGLVERSLFLVTNDPVQPRVELVFDATVQAPVLADEEAVFFNDTLLHDRPVRKVRVRSFGSADLHLSLRNEPPPCLQVAVTGSGREAWITVTADGAKFPREGGLKGGLLFTTGVPESPELTLEYFGYPGHAVEARPEGLSFDPALTGKPQAYEVELVEVRERPFRVKGIVQVPPPFKAELLTAGSAARHVLRVSIGAGVPAGSHAGTIVLAVDDPDQETVEIPVRAELQ